MQNHQHPGQPSKNDKAKLSRSSNATATPHILPYISRGTVKTTNPKHTPPTRPAGTHTWRPEMSTAPSPQHTIQWRTRPSKEHSKQKPCTKPNAAPPAVQKQSPLAKVQPREKKTHSIQAESLQSQNPTEKPRPVPPEINNGQPALPNHADPSDPPPPDRTGTGFRNRSPDKEPESEPGPNEPRNPGPNDAYPHPSPTTHLQHRRKPTPTPTYEQLISPHKTLYTQVDSTSPPPTDPPPRQQNALLEGESTCNEMVPTHPFRRPLSPPMHQTPQEPREPKPTPEPPRSSMATRPVTYNVCSMSCQGSSIGLCLNHFEMYCSLLGKK
ncbi:hypothetical protein CRENBAI_000522 [Crenichthys baileyi]|uniref:Uncharacterized protein n=1 Tax=Crenichthys baileyi TaxID=28760 RepID=A0AAV9S6H9_9TELE